MTERRPSDILWKAASLVLALGGLAGFILIFVRHMNVYWFILSPIILSVYEIPAVVVYGTWKKRRRGKRKPADRAPPANKSGNSGSPVTPPTGFEPVLLP